MKYKLKLSALVICGAMLSAFASGCSDDNSVQPNKGVYEEENSSSDSLSGGEQGGVLDNVDESSETGKVYTQTIMVYMVGSDLESSYGAATLDLAEMEEALPSPGENNIVVCAGGASQWKNTIISEEEQTLLQLEEGGFTVIDTLESKNMGEAENLGSFIKQCMEHYETDLYSLILWDHGAGPVLGFGVDENYGDILSLPEMQSALENSVGKSGKKLEWIGFDACLMSSLELCDAFAPYANFMIASQETEPGWGWNYGFLSALSEPDMDGAHLGREIIDTYMEYSENIFEENPRAYADLTLSCLDLNKYQQTEDTLNAFFAETHEALTVSAFPEAVRDRRSVKEFGGFSSSYSYCLVDTVDLIEALAAKDSLTEGAAIAAIRDMTVYMRTNVDNAGGVSVCYPYNAEEKYTDICLKMHESIGFAENYTDYLNDFYAIQKGETIASEWDITGAESSVHDIATPVPETDDGEEPAAVLSSGKDICLQLTEEQKENFGSAAYYILCRAEAGGFIDGEDDQRADDMYVFIHGGKNVQMDQAGVLHAHYNNNVVYMKDEKTGELSETPMVLIDNDSSSKEKRYLTSVVLTKIGEELSDWDTQAANLQIIVDSEHPEGEIRSAVPILADDEVQRASKQLLSLDDFTYMSVTGRCSYLTRDEKGDLLPFFDWENSGWLMGFEQDLTEGYSLEVTSIQNPENYVCMFVVTDSQGNSSVSELIPLG